MKNTPYSIRVDLCYSMEKMSFFLGITTSTYDLKEKGKSRFTLREMKKIAEIGNVSIDDMEEI